MAKLTYIEWLEKRIETTEKEILNLDETTKLQIIVGKGAKLKAYKECLNYCETHDINL